MVPQEERNCQNPKATTTVWDENSQTQIKVTEKQEVDLNKPPALKVRVLKYIHCIEMNTVFQVFQHVTFHILLSL